jgi:excisionase family DNA binding protein
MTGIIMEINKEELCSLIAQAVRHELTNAGLNSISSSYEKEEDIMTAEEVCTLLNLKMAGLYQKTHARQIPFMKQGKKLYFSRQKINEWLKSGGVITMLQERLEDDKSFCEKNKNRLKKITGKH